MILILLSSQSTVQGNITLSPCDCDDMEHVRRAGCVKHSSRPYYLTNKKTIRGAINLKFNGVSP